MTGGQLFSVGVWNVIIEADGTCGGVKREAAALPEPVDSTVPRVLEFRDLGWVSPTFFCLPNLSTRRASIANSAEL